MPRNEFTSAKVAKIAGRLLQGLTAFPVKGCTFYLGEWFTVAELKALAASALTQTRDRGGKKK